MKNYEEMSIKEKKSELGEVFGLYNLYNDFQKQYDNLPDDLKEKLNKEFETNKPSELIRTLSIVVSDLYHIAEEMYPETEDQNEEDEEEER